MYLFRLVTILILLPVTVLSGMPHVGCKCSTGEVRLSCPKLTAERARKTSEATTCCNSEKTVVHKSCCSGNEVTKCCGSSRHKLPSDGESCCADGCRCTPVLLTAEIGLKLAKVSIPEIVQNDLANISAVSCILVRISRIDIDRFELKPDVPIDLIVLFERFLI